MAIDGTWNMTMNSPMGAREVKLDLAAAGAALSGNFAGQAGSTPLTGTVDGAAVAFTTTINGPMGQMELKFDGKLDGDALAGNVQFGSFGSGTWSAARG